MLTSYVADGHTSFLCTYALYGGSVHNVFDACRYITRASVRGLGPLEIKSFLGTVKWHRADRGVPFWAQKTQDFQGRTPPTCSSIKSAFIKNQYKLGHINHRCIGDFMYKSPRVILTEFIDKFSRKKYIMFVFNHWKQMFGFFFVAKTGSRNSTTGKEGGRQ